MRKPHCFIGLDISADTFAAAVSTENNTSVDFLGESFTNDQDGYSAFVDLLKEKQINNKNSAVCLEITGSYSEHVCYYLSSHGFPVWSEAPHKISKTFHKQTKNDRVDATQIAEYCYRYFDRFKNFEPGDAIIDKVRALLALREQMSKQSTAYKNMLHAFKRKYFQTQVANNVLKDTIKQLELSTKQIDKEINELINDNSKYGPTATALKSIPGIGMLFIANFFIVTNGFSLTVNYKNMASYIGICPHEYSSGTSVYKRPKSSGYGPKRLRKLLYLASMSVRTHNPKFHNYFERKVAEGKNKHLVLNNIANKILRIACAINETGCDYSDNYLSVHPKYLK